LSNEADKVEIVWAQMHDKRSMDSEQCDAGNGSRTTMSQTGH